MQRDARGTAKTGPLPSLSPSVSPPFRIFAANRVRRVRQCRLISPLSRRYNGGRAVALWKTRATMAGQWASISVTECTASLPLRSYWLDDLGTVVRATSNRGSKEAFRQVAWKSEYRFIESRSRLITARFLGSVRERPIPRFPADTFNSRDLHSVITIGYTCNIPNSYTTDVVYYSKTITKNAV